MYTLPNLSYDYAALEPFIDELTMHIHHDKHHAAYIKNVNDALMGHPDLASLSIEALLKHITQVPSDIRTKVINNGGGHYNHSLYWLSMAPQEAGGGKPSDSMMQVLEKSFGGLGAFQEKFASMALARFGSGWVWLTAHDGLLAIEDSANQDTPLTAGRVPVLALDVWEHAYYLKYQNTGRAVAFPGYLSGQKILMA